MNRQIDYPAPPVIHKNPMKNGIFSNINMVNRISSINSISQLPRNAVGAAARSSWPTGRPRRRAQCCGTPRGAGHGPGGPAGRFRHGGSLWCGAGTVRRGKEAGFWEGKMEMWMEEVRTTISVFFFLFFCCVVWGCGWCWFVGYFKVEMKLGFSKWVSWRSGGHKPNISDSRNWMLAMRLMEMMRMKTLKPDCNSSIHHHHHHHQHHHHHHHHHPPRTATLTCTALAQRVVDKEVEVALRKTPLLLATGLCLSSTMDAGGAIAWQQALTIFDFTTSHIYQETFGNWGSLWLPTSQKTFSGWTAIVSFCDESPSLRPTARTWKWMVAIRSFPFGKPLVSGAMLVSGRVPHVFLKISLRKRTSILYTFIWCSFRTWAERVKETWDRPCWEPFSIVISIGEIQNTIQIPRNTRCFKHFTQFSLKFFRWVVV